MRRTCGGMTRGSARAATAAAESPGCTLFKYLNRHIHQHARQRGQGPPCMLHGCSTRRERGCREGPPARREAPSFAPRPAPCNGAVDCCMPKARATTQVAAAGLKTCIAWRLAALDGHALEVSVRMGGRWGFVALRGGDEGEPARKAKPSGPGSWARYRLRGGQPRPSGARPPPYARLTHSPGTHLRGPPRTIPRRRALQ